MRAAGNHGSPDAPLAHPNSEEAARELTLAAEGISFRYQRFDLAPLSFRAGSGTVVAIVGPNGSGKSTLLEVVSGHLRPLTGTVRLGNLNVHRLSPRERAQRIGLARQETILLFSFELREFVRQGRHAHLGHALFETGEDEEWVNWAIEKTGLQEFIGRRVTEMSSGEFQRAVLARTLAQRPRLLLLDEPTANLDIGYQIEMFRLVRDLAIQERFIAIVVTHELNLAAEMADYLLLMEKGQCLRQGGPEEVLDARLLSRIFRTPVSVEKNSLSGRPRVIWAAR
jgi:ABC-type cobalamin/Fe3+-siderophores transport system ATPase subunit